MTARALVTAWAVHGISLAIIGCAAADLVAWLHRRPIVRQARRR